jgi:PAS domain S-box-containing protein
LIGQPQTILHPPSDDNELFSPAFKQHLGAQAGQVLDTQVINKAGEIKEVAIRAKTLNLAGKRVMQGLFRDITERKRAEEALRKNEAMLSCILNSLPLSVFWKNHESVYFGCNETFARGANLRPEDVIGKTDFDLPWSHEDTEAYRADDREVMTSRRAKIHIAEQQHRADGTCIWLDTTKIPLLDSKHKVYGVLGIYDDITERKRMEDELHKAKDAADAANRTKSQFLANMSHEIRTPMTAILGYADLLMDPTLSPSSHNNYLAVIRRSGKHLLTLINDILDLSKIEAGKLTMDMQRCSVVSLLAEVASVVRPRAEQHGISLSVKYTCPMPETILTDGARLRQAIINLAGNAVKFTQRGSVRIVASFLSNGCDGQPGVAIEVIDTGIGIREDILPQLFQPFHQGDASVSRKFGGTGLGLAISHHIAHLLGGDLTATSVWGQGSTFLLTVATGSLDGIAMLERPAEIECDAADKACESTTENLKGLRILLAEDGFDNRELISTVLRKVGAVVETAENGRIAVAKAEATPFDLILMDMNMPEMDGYEATRLLRDRGYAQPIVALTANAMSGDCEQCLAAGCNQYAAKPIDRLQLIRIIAACVGKESIVEGVTPAPKVRHEVLVVREDGVWEIGGDQPAPTDSEDQFGWVTDERVDGALLKIEKGLRDYRWLQAEVSNIDVAKDALFQRRFNAFYRVRRDASWRRAYYRLLQDSKAKGVSFAVALWTLKRATGRIEASFASKLVATLEPTMPVIDKFVLRNLGLRLPVHKEDDREEKIIAVYERLRANYVKLVASVTGRRICEKFRRSYGEVGITEVKMIDLVLWQMR